ncbi:oxidoreductase [Pajaroellobacter abortibovis]|uniref:Oxidoreductase n=1 Tax=Pajaroellobacter abortibovis TaxID=1882918 RepID=A0A1L6MZ98_9BACT|nr:oxidoreductase [Pajaroellobacter abortibovis]
MKNFVLLGVAGHVAARHLEAIRKSGHRVIAAADPKDSVGILDQYDFDVHFFTETERLDRHLEKLRQRNPSEGAHYVSVCSPNYLHDAHCRLGLRLQADVICEKPIVINPSNLDSLERLEEETEKQIYPILQLRYHPQLQKIHKITRAEKPPQKHEVLLTYITPRGRWYHISWKGSEEKSGGLLTNIGIHIFDILLWLFGDVETYQVHHLDKNRVAGFLELKSAHVHWFLSIAKEDVEQTGTPPSARPLRSLILDGEEIIDVSTGFEHLHLQAYQAILKGEGLSLQQSRPSIELAYRLRHAPLHSNHSPTHPFLKQKGF